ncbi:MAG: hypothetical protein FWG12_04125 [Holophagaceae bacterium]|nr:hypothetical protein [Holophagaceae bacterium]
MGTKAAGSASLKSRTNGTGTPTFRKGTEEAGWAKRQQIDIMGRTEISMRYSLQEYSVRNEPTEIAASRYNDVCVEFVVLVPQF